MTQSHHRTRDINRKDRTDGYLAIPVKGTDTLADLRKLVKECQYEMKRAKLEDKAYWQDIIDNAAPQIAFLEKVHNR